MRNRPKKTNAQGRLLAPFAALVFVASAGGCDQLLDVDRPGEILAENLQGPESAELLAFSALSDFECALARYIVTAGTLGNELYVSNLGSANWPLGQRNLTDRLPYGVSGCAGGYALYVPVSTARWQADNVLRRMQDDWAGADIPDRDNLVARAATIAGYSLNLLGESMCSAAIDQGPEMFPEDFFREAANRLQIAVDAATNPQIRNWARVGLGRALLNAGNVQAAADAVRDVPEGFVFSTNHSNATNTRRNHPHWHISRDRNGVVTRHYFERTTWNGELDPRVPVVEVVGQITSDPDVPFWNQLKYPGVDSPIPIARWEEAQLIIAEAEGGETAVRIINELHSRAGLPPYDPNIHTTPGPYDEITNMIIETRAREFFLEGHHLGDLRRYELPLVPAPGEPYPWTGGGFYGGDRCFPAPFSEKDSNPNFGG